MLRVGRINSRSLDGPIRLPDKYREQVQAVEQTYDTWFKVWKESYLPKLLFRPKWFRTDQHLKEGDLVYFIKSESKLSNQYTMGKVDQVIVGKDGIIRIAIIKYYNGTNPEPKFSDRAVRSVAKIFSIDDFCLTEDLAILQRRLNKRFGAQENDDQDQANDDQDGFIASVCSSDDHSSKDLLANLNILLKQAPRADEILVYFPTACNLTAGALQPELVSEDTVAEQCTSVMEELDNMDKLSQLIMSVNLKLD